MQLGVGGGALGISYFEILLLEKKNFHTKRPPNLYYIKIFFFQSFFFESRPKY